MAASNNLDYFWWLNNIRVEWIQFPRANIIHKYTTQFRKLIKKLELIISMIHLLLRHTTWQSVIGERPGGINKDIIAWSENMVEQLDNVDYTKQLDILLEGPLFILCIDLCERWSPLESDSINLTVRMGHPFKLDTTEK